MSYGQLGGVSIDHDKVSVGRLTVVAQEHNGRSDAVLLRDLVNNLILEQRRTRAAERAVRCDMDTFLLAEVDDFLLWAQWVVLNLVDCGDNGGFGKQLLQVLDRVVGDANGLDLVGMRLDQLLEVFPCVLVGDGAVDIARAVFMLGEQRVVACDSVSILP